MKFHIISVFTFALATAALAGCSAPEVEQAEQANSNLTSDVRTAPSEGCGDTCVEPALLKALFASPLKVYGVTGLPAGAAPPTIGELIAKRMSEGLYLSVRTGPDTKDPSMREVTVSFVFGDGEGSGELLSIRFRSRTGELVPQDMGPAVPANGIAAHYVG